MFYRYCNTPIAAPPIKTNKVLRTSAKLNNNNNNNNNSSNSANKKNSQPTEKRCTRMSSGRIVKKQKLSKESTTTTDETMKFGNSDSENDQSLREPWLVSPIKPIKTPEESKVGVVLRSSSRIPKSWKCNNPKEESTPPKSTTISKIKTPLTEPMTRILRSHKKKGSRRFKNVASRSSWSAGMVTRSNRRSVKY